MIGFVVGLVAGALGYRYGLAYVVKKGWLS